MHYAFEANLCINKASKVKNNRKEEWEHTVVLAAVIYGFQNDRFMILSVDISKLFKRKRPKPRYWHLKIQGDT